MPTNKGFDKDPNNGQDLKLSTFSLQNFNSTAKLNVPRVSVVTVNEKDELYDPFAERKVEHPNSDAGALIHLLKGSLGTGILTMPLAFKYGGLYFSIIGTLVTGILCTHCIHILVKSSQEICRRAKRPSLDYPETAALAFEYGPEGYQKFAGFARSCVKCSLIATYLGSNSVYVYFIAKSIQDLIKQYNNNDEVFSISIYMIYLLVILIPLSQIRNLKFLVPFSGVANVCMLAVFSIVLYYLFTDIQSPSDRTAIGTIYELPKFFTTVIFAMEGIGVILPIENTMTKPQHFLGCPGVLNIAMSAIMALYTVVGFFGYLKYPDIDDTITSYIPIEYLPGQIVRILIAVAVILTYGLQMFVPLELIWDISKGCFSSKYKNIGEITVRTLFSILTVVLAAVINDLEVLIGLVGAICLSILGVMIPVIVETVTCLQTNSLGRFYWKLIKNALLMLFAAMTMICGSVTSIQQLIEIHS